MAHVKKFGTFGGVFTPSILTILGVIMYLRLPWIVGQAGLYMTIGIVLVAHIISITTGMSVASIATDKRVKAGGTYFMISRSLGLPVGGTLGLALFVGLSFSVSLYLIGFSESLLSFMGHDASKQSIQIAGTIALVAVTTITLISTSLAIKTQFLIMLAIILSLGSIFIGNNTFAPGEPLLKPIQGCAPFIVLFGIFFPAVTGFESGVSMSGDLRDPKRAIPLGTITAIAVGLAVYIGMAVYFAFTVQSEQLFSNPNVLLDIALSPHVVVAGIWGATISSALGSILGAPRILQATSLDKITPKFFGKGYGRENEPRHALLFTFCIAEAGILIGELDVIARIVSMFFITTYGFLNLSCALESWASPDFRPEFKIPKIISIVGSVTCFIVMIQLDLLAMIGAVIILSGIFFYLKRKELTLETGDTWEGIWSSMIRVGLNRLNRKKTHQRNWRPNIILFSGGTEARPHLIDLGKWLVDKRGLLSNFDLVENPGLKVLSRKADQSIRDDADDFSGVFARRIECSDKYDCMEIISKYYGFSGIEPNTILMGWGHNTQNPDKFVHVLKSIMDLDYNLMLLSFDESREFGNHETIDIWWRGGGNNISLALALARYLTSSDLWAVARLRFLTIAMESASTEILHNNMDRLLTEYRIEGTVKIINNAVEKKSFHDIVQYESAKTDLVILGIPDIAFSDAQNYIQKTNQMLEPLGSTLLIFAASFFNDIFINEETRKILLNEAPHEEGVKPGMRSAAKKTHLLPVELSATFRQFPNLLKDVNANFDTSFLRELFNINHSFLFSVHNLVKSSFETLEKKMAQNDRQRNNKLILKTQSDFLFQVQKIVEDFNRAGLQSSQTIMEAGILWLRSQLPDIPGMFPEHVRTSCSVQSLLAADAKGFAFRLFKIYKRFAGKFSGGTIRYNVHFRVLTGSYVKTVYLPAFSEAFKLFAIHCYFMVQELQKLIDATMDLLGLVEKRQLTEDTFSFDAVIAEKQKLFEEIDNAANQCQLVYQNTLSLLSQTAQEIIDALADDLSRPDINFLYQIKQKGKLKWNPLLEKTFGPISLVWAENQSHVLHLALLDLTLLSMKNRLRTIAQKTKADVRLTLENNYIDKLEGVETYLQGFLDNLIHGQMEKIKMPHSFKEKVEITSPFEQMISEIHSLIRQLPEDMSVIDAQSMKQFSEKPFDSLETRQISLQRLVEYIIETEFTGPIQEKIEEVAGMTEQADNIGQDVTRLILLNQNEIESADDTRHTVMIDNFKSSIQIGIDRIKETRITFETIGQNLDDNFTRFLGSVFDKLNPYSIAQAFETLPHYFREQQSQKVISHFEHFIDSARKKIAHVNIQLRYSKYLKSLAGMEQNNTVKGSASVEEILDFVESVSPDPHALSALPDYYKHLFLGNPSITKEFWMGRKDELNQAEKAIQRYHHHPDGALMIIGDPSSGKTALSNYIAARHFDTQTIYQINPPAEGSINVSVFGTRLKNSLQLKGDYRDIFKNLPAGSVIVLNDMELWWERSEHGFDVLDVLLSFIHNFSHTCLFLLNMNIHSYKLINSIKKIDDYFLDIIHCSPVDAETIKDIVLLRHSSTNLKFNYQHQPEDSLSELKMAQLFIQLAQDSKGNIGTALQYWVRAIQKAGKDIIDIEIPKQPDLTILDRLDTSYLVLCGQVFLHKRLSMGRLVHLTQMAANDITQSISALKRCGLLTENTGNVYEINPFVRPYITDFFAKKGII